MPATGIMSTNNNIDLVLHDSVQTTTFDTTYNFYDVVVELPPSLHDSYEVADDTNIGLLWVPYAILAGIFLTLIIASFCHFHIKHGDRYRKRRFEALRQLNLSVMVRQMQEQVEIMGSMGSPPTVRATLPSEGGIQAKTSGRRKSFFRRLSTIGKPKDQGHYNTLFASNELGSMVLVNGALMGGSESPLLPPHPSHISVIVTDDSYYDNNHLRIPTNVTMESFVLSASNSNSSLGHAGK